MPKKKSTCIKKKTLYCKECQYTTKIKSYLKKHLWRAHSIGKGVMHKCPKCDYSTKEKRNLKLHMHHRHKTHEP